MIRIKTIHSEFALKPTIFPDGTSQVWKLPTEILNRKEYLIIWNFESEREIIDLYSLSLLLGYHVYIHLHIPYLPYGRQDKSVSNDTTFNLAVFADLINALGFDKVTTVDAHNKQFFEKYIHNAVNLPVTGIHEKMIMNFLPTYIVFPDAGAVTRYNLSHLSTIYCDKVRDQATGAILSHKVLSPPTLHAGKERLLIIDDICDGGATFISVAKALREISPNMIIGLFVTHGIFSKGRQHLLDNGIDEIYTTDSLLKNTGDYEV